MQDRAVIMSEADLRAALQEAATQGARQALAAVGLHDERAAGDIGDLRDLLSAWRDAKKTAWRAFVQTATKVVLLLLAVGVGWHLWGRP
jgi:hypothetical protein